MGDLIGLVVLAAMGYCAIRVALVVGAMVSDQWRDDDRPHRLP